MNQNNLIYTFASSSEGEKILEKLNYTIEWPTPDKKFALVRLIPSEIKEEDKNHFIRTQVIANLESNGELYWVSNRFPYYYREKLINSIKNLN